MKQYKIREILWDIYSESLLLFSFFEWRHIFSSGMDRTQHLKFKFVHKLK